MAIDVVINETTVTIQLSIPAVLDDKISKSTYIDAQEAVQTLPGTPDNDTLYFVVPTLTS